MYKLKCALGYLPTQDLNPKEQRAPMYYHSVYYISLYIIVENV